MKVTKLFLLCAAVVVAGCGSKGSSGYTPKPIKTATVTPIAPGEDKTLFPVAVGNQWTYESVSDSVSQNQPRRVTQNITMEVKAIEPDGNGQKVTVELREEDVIKSTQIWKIDDTGVYQVSVKTEQAEAQFTPPQCVLKFPVKVDEEWTYEGVAPSALGIKSNNKSVSTNKGPQLVDTYAGQVSAYRVDTKTELTGSAMQDGKSVPLAGSQMSSAFFAPKMGMVRLVQTVQGRAGAETVTLQLLQSTVK
jgi:hypothetical protein